MSKGQYVKTEKCLYNENVVCEEYEKCKHCGFEPHEHTRRVAKIRKAFESDAPETGTEGNE